MIDREAFRLYPDDVTGLFRRLNGLGTMTDILETIEALYREKNFNPNFNAHRSALDSAGIAVARMEVALSCVLAKDISHSVGRTWEKFKEEQSSKLPAVSLEEVRLLMEYWAAGPKPGLQPATASATSGSPSDFFLYFSGVAGGGKDHGGVTDAKTGGDAVATKDLPTFAQRHGVSLVPLGWLGSMKRVRGVTAAFDTIVHSSQYHPHASRLVMYGHSAGAVNAMTVCRRFDQHNAGVGPSGKLVTVTLLITVDPAAQEETDQIDRSVAKCVRRNVNFWQNGELSAQVLGWSRGAPNTGPCGPDNREITGKHTVDGKLVSVTHSNIDTITWLSAQTEIQAAISR